jgi:hypothetical protein
LSFFKQSENPLLGAYRVSAALEQMGIKLSRATCGRYLSIATRRRYATGDVKAAWW